MDNYIIKKKTNKESLENYMLNTKIEKKNR